MFLCFFCITSEFGTPGCFKFDCNCAKPLWRFVFVTFLQGLFTLSFYNNCPLQDSVSLPNKMKLKLQVFMFAFMFDCSFENHSNFDVSGKSKQNKSNKGI